MSEPILIADNTPLKARLKSRRNLHTRILLAGSTALGIALAARPTPTNRENGNVG